MKIRKFIQNYLEVIIWSFALVSLFMSVYMNWESVTICPLSLAGFDHCPGCGLGHAVGLLLNGEVEKSLAAHPLGVPALVILITRIISITIKSNKNGTSIKAFTRTQR